MNFSRNQPMVGFTLVEMLIGISLSLMIMGAVLSSYVFLGKNFTRSLGLSSANQPTLESQGRRALSYFEQDVRMATGIDLTGIPPKVMPSAEGVTFILPTNSGTTTVTYTYDSVTHTLLRAPETGPPLVLQTNLKSFSFTFYDSSPTASPNFVGNPYTSAALSAANYLSGIKQISMSFSCQGGLSANGTLTELYQVASPRIIFRNKQLLP